ncbi:hypothetical protein RND81_01G068800 [Saponaria officinalis]|uniref:Uncharacterized protein n=1 Tax=Saponaria officinalis TaxID=3572 RepID=A0AAW1NC56_SAPOF
MRKLHPLILFLLILTQPKPGTPDPDDETCLTQLHSSFLNPTLHNWTRPFFSNPYNLSILYHSKLTSIKQN